MDDIILIGAWILTMIITTIVIVAIRRNHQAHSRSSQYGGPF